MTGRQARAIWVGLLMAGLIFHAPAAWAAVSCSSSLDRNRAQMGEQLVLTVSVEGDVRNVSDPDLPDLANFDLYSGGQSQRFSFVNGQVSASHSFTYYLRARKTGKFTIPAIVVMVDGSKYETQPIPVTIAAGANPAQKSPTRSNTTAPRDAQSLDDAYFVTMTVDEDTVVVGEQIVLTFSFYRGVRGSFFDSPQYTPPKTEGFWREDLPPEKHTTMVIRGHSYDVTQIQYALFPTRAGDLEVGEAVVRIPEDRFGSLFRRRQKRGDVLLRAPAISITVRPLPPNPPVGFTGTVAEGLTLRMKTDRQSLPVGDALTLILTLEGDGYMAAAQKPKLPEMMDFRVHDSGSSVESRPLGGKLHGALSVEKLLIPQQEGPVTIPAVRYPYYDTAKHRYVTLSTRPADIDVLPADGDPISSFASGGKTEIEILGQDILHIQPIAGQLRPYQGPLPRRAIFWTLAALGPAVWGASSLLARRRRRLYSDPMRLRASRAAKEARERLRADGTPSQRVSNALLGYVAAKSGRASAGITAGEAVEWLQRAGVSTTTMAAYTDLLSRCDQERFASNAGLSSEPLLEQGEDVLKLVDGEVGRA